MPVIYSEMAPFIMELNLTFCCIFGKTPISAFKATFFVKKKAALMGSWFSYINQQFPQVLWIPFILGISLSGASIGGEEVKLWPVLLAGFGIWMTLLQLRLINDYNDYQKDQIAHHDYPLPRRLFNMKQAFKGIVFLQIVLFAYSEILWIALQPIVALMMFIISIYCILYYNLFFVENSLQAYPFLRLFVQNIAAFLIALFSVAASHPFKIMSLEALFFAGLIYTSFCIYQICRKLSPKMHPISATIVHYYGFQAAFTTVAFLAVLSAFFSAPLPSKNLLWVFQCGIIMAMSIVWIFPELYWVAAWMATSSLVVHSYALCF